MLLKDLKKVYISRPERVNLFGEYEIRWILVAIAYLNLQQDVNELDRNSFGEVNYDIIKARTDKNYNIKNGYGISFKIDEKEKALTVNEMNKILIKKLDILNVEYLTKDFIVVGKPEYRVLNQSIVGQSYLYRLEQYHGD